MGKKQQPDFSYTPSGPSDPDEGKIKGDIYHSDEIGWTIEIPNGWNVTDRDELDRRQDKGKDIFEERLGEEIEIVGLKNLINFQKDKANVFMSTSQRFVEEYPGEYEDVNNTLKQVIYDTYTSQGIKTDSLSYKLMFKGKLFYAFHTTIYAENGDEILNQLMFSKWINGYDFGAVVNYNNEADKKVMMDALKNSTFN